MSPKWTVRIAEEDDLDGVVNILNQAGARLADKGLDQWGREWMPASRMAKMIARSETYVVHGSESGHLEATVTMSPDPGPFWTEEERGQQAIYLGKLARSNDATPGVGTWVMNSWAPAWAAANGYEVIRLDAWATNPALHEYYSSRGWTYVRHESIPGNKSGALFEHYVQVREEEGRPHGRHPLRDSSGHPS